MANSTLLILVTIALISLIDYIPRAFIRIKKPVKANPGYDKIPRYIIMPTVYGDIKYLENVAFLKKYAAKVIICTSNHESEEFYRDLRRACRRYGFRYIKAEVPVVRGKPVKNAYSIYKGALKNLNRLKVRKDTPCLLMDADTFAVKNVNNLIRAFIASGTDIASVRCEAAKPQKLIEVLQDYEYRLAMDNRRMDPWLTSGAASLGKAGVLQHIFSRHSDFFAGGDSEIGKLAKVMGYKIKHIDFTFYTAVPDTFKAWYKQRLIWFAGGFRHHIANIGAYNWHHFFLFFYNSLLVFLLWPLRWVEVLHFPLTMFILVAFAWAYTAILMYRRGWRVQYLVLPVYAFLQSMIILPHAVMYYVKFSLQQRSLGLLKFDLSSQALSYRFLGLVMNVALAVMVVYAAYAFTVLRLNYWAVN